MKFTYALLQHQNGNYGVSFPDFPGCISGGNTAEEAISRASETLNFHIKSMQDDGEQLPEPRLLNAILKDTKLQDELKTAAIAVIQFGK